MLVDGEREGIKLRRGLSLFQQCNQQRTEVAEETFDALNDDSCPAGRPGDPGDPGGLWCDKVQIELGCIHLHSPNQSNIW